jgi:hypothetical protein
VVPANRHFLPFPMAGSLQPHRPHAGHDKLLAFSQSLMRACNCGRQRNSV